MCCFGPSFFSPGHLGAGKHGGAVARWRIVRAQAGISVFHMGDSPRMLEPLYQILDSCDVPITKLLPTHVNRAEPLFQSALEYARKGGYIDITSSIDEPVDPATAIATALRQNVPLSRITLSSDGNGSQPEFDDYGNLTGIGVAGFESLAETVRQLVKVHAIPLELALCPLTRTVAEFWDWNIKDVWRWDAMPTFWCSMMRLKFITCGRRAKPSSERKSLCKRDV